MQGKFAEYLDFANYLADQAALISQKYFRQQIPVDSKAGNYPVTIADREIELSLRELIKTNFPDHGIIGEEYANTDEEKPWCWVIDPIDGTVAFTAGKPVFTTLIALIFKGTPVLSIIDQSITKERFLGVYGESAFLNGHKLKTSYKTDLDTARLNATTPYMFISDYEKAKFDVIRRKVKVTSFGGDAYAYGLLAAGHIDIIMEADLQYYDVAALIPIIEASGGIITDWQGNTITRKFNGQCLASANPILHKKVLEQINQ